MNKEATIENCEVGPLPTGLCDIHQTNVNIAIYNRDITALTSEVKSLKEQQVEIRSSGNVDTILKTLVQAIDPNKFNLILRDIKELLHLFKEVTNASNFRLLLAKISTTMCPRFHADNNELRMLCTYHGPGTLWLPDYAVDRDAYLTGKRNKSIISNESLAQQVETGDVVILKGSLYPGATPILHRSPSILGDDEKRLLLSIDINESLNLPT
ncbi:MAG: DUF1826 domain-containing protein [Bacteroidota bacterium]